MRSCPAMPNFPPSQEDMQKFHANVERMRAAGRELIDRAIALGYNYAVGDGAQLADRSTGIRAVLRPNDIQPTFHVWRVDQPSAGAEIFATVAELNEYLEHVATLPRYCLELEGNPRLVIDTENNGSRTVIGDKLSGESFGIATRPRVMS
jgi:hypothetical protein